MRFFLHILIALLITSCSAHMPESPSFDPPYVEYQITGKVIDSLTKEPVKGIMILHYETYINYQTQEVDMIDKVVNSTQVENDGTFSISGILNNDNYQYVYLKCEDINKHEDGSYLPKFTLVTLTPEEVTSREVQGYQGKFTSEVTIEISSTY